MKASGLQTTKRTKKKCVGIPNIKSLNQVRYQARINKSVTSSPQSSTPKLHVMTHLNAIQIPQNHVRGRATLDRELSAEGSKGEEKNINSYAPPTEESTFTRLAGTLMNIEALEKEWNTFKEERLSRSPISRLTTSRTPINTANQAPAVAGNFSNIMKKAVPYSKIDLAYLHKHDSYQKLLDTSLSEGNERSSSVPRDLSHFKSICNKYSNIYKRQAAQQNSNNILTTSTSDCDSDQSKRNSIGFSGSNSKREERNNSASKESKVSRLNHHIQTVAQKRDFQISIVEELAKVRENLRQVEERSEMSHLFGAKDSPIKRLKKTPIA
eukprot:TRINITY_DN21919_c0_g1_i1.p1 TRINITY_DN21919_c0_g1~~TRINITY_DN21919_c0_g1_i1.p1  ORF type:complete len:325 (+),score=49.02 TRINITY_DN21919_c0_g1_i1:36-1010(+)